MTIHIQRDTNGRWQVSRRLPYGAGQFIESFESRRDAERKARQVAKSGEEITISTKPFSNVPPAVVREGSKTDLELF